VRTTWRRRGAWWTRSLHAVTPDHAYEPQTWGPAEADRIIAHEGGWRNPTPVEAAS
jgi:glucose-6-phosphate 1-dehydrogenase